MQLATISFSVAKLRSGELGLIDVWEIILRLAIPLDSAFSCGYTGALLRVDSGSHCFNLVSLTSETRKRGGVISQPSAEIRENHPQVEAESTGDDPRLSLLERVVASEHFAKSPHLVKFLRYICEQALLGRPESINEQIVGNRVFGRAFGYNSNEDNIVRAHASRLRQKLGAYFANEGRAEPVCIVIPKGSYVPDFSPNREPAFVASGETSLTPQFGNLPTPIPVEQPLAELSDKPQRRRSRLWIIVAIVACFTCVFATLGLMSIQKKSGAAEAMQGPPNHLLWASLGGKKPLLVVPGDSSLAIYDNVTGRTARISEYVGGEYRSLPEAQSIMTPTELATIARRRLTSIVDLQAVSRILLRPEIRNGQASVMYARDLRLEDLKQADVILIGSAEANPWVQLFDGELNFNIVPDQKTKIFTVVNHSPQAGEQPEYRSDPGSASHLTYALVSYAPNVSGNGHVLIVQGTAMAGTQAASDFALVNPELSNLLKLAHSRNGFPNKFEVLLQSSNLNGGATSAKVIAYRVYP
jgi:hypothetical protein